MSDRLYSVLLNVSLVIVLLLLVLTVLDVSKAEAAVKWVDGNPVFYTKKVVKKKVYSKRKRYAKKRRYAK